MLEIPNKKRGDTGACKLFGYLPGFQARTSSHWPTPGHDLVRRFSVGFCPGVNIGWEFHSEKVQGEERPNKKHEGKIILNGFYTYWLVLIWYIKTGSAPNGSLGRVVPLRPSKLPTFCYPFWETRLILFTLFRWQSRCHMLFKTKIKENHSVIMKSKKNVVPFSRRPLHIFRS